MSNHVSVVYQFMTPLMFDLSYNLFILTSQRRSIQCLPRGS